MSELHPLDRAIEFEVVDDEVVRGRTRPEWANMVGPFGGITAAAILHAIDVHPDRLGEPVALTVNFAAPIADGDFEISRRAPRTNRTNQHWIVELSQAGEVKTTATAVFGNHRDTWSDTEAVMPVVPSPDEIPRTNHTNLPTWVHMYDMRFADGSFSGDNVEAGPSSASTLWVRDGAQRGLDFPALTALSDIFFPRIFLRRGIVASGTISMTTYFHADGGHLEALGGDFVLGTAGPTASTADFSTRARNCGVVTARCWPRRIRSSISRARSSALLFPGDPRFGLRCRAPDRAASSQSPLRIEPPCTLEDLVMTSEVAVVPPA